MKKKQILIGSFIGALVALLLFFYFTLFGIVKIDVYPNENKTIIIRKVNNENLYFGFLKPKADKFLNSGDLIVYRNPTIFDLKFRKKDNLCARIIGMPGDIISIVDTKIFINDVALDEEFNVFFLYRLSTEEPSDFNALLEKYNVEIISTLNESKACEIICTQNIAEEIAKMDGVINLRKIIVEKDTNNKGTFPNNMFYSWNKDNFGPVAVPQKDVTVMLNYRNVPLYETIIDIFEDHQLIYDMSKILIDNQDVKQYTFKMNYYFVVNDNRYDNKDSRSFGFVPENHIVGKVIN